MKTEGIMGCILLIASGCIYTVERFVSVLMWLGEVVPVKMSPSGSYPSNATMPGLFDNIFVPILFIVGVLLVVISFRIKEQDKI